MKFIHCADLHLDSKIDGLPSDKSKIRRDEILRTFERLCDYASVNSVMAVIIAGDMFDTARVTTKTRDRVFNAIKKNPNVDFLYLSGNHDDENFISASETLPENLKVFGESWSNFRYGNVTISGVILNALNSRTIYDTLKLSEQEINIVCMHGQVAGYKSDEAAEIISIPRLKDKFIDYLALGHIHSYSKGDINHRGKYAYSGCLDGRGFDELGDKGFVLIEVENEKLNTEFVNFSSRNLEVFEFNVEDFSEWYSASEQLFIEIKSAFKQTDLIKVVLKGSHKTDFYIDKDNLANRLNEYFFFAKVYDRTELKVEPEDYLMDKSVRGEFVRTVWESDMSAEDKHKVILCGLNALKGEEI